MVLVIVAGSKLQGDLAFLNKNIFFALYLIAAILVTFVYEIIKFQFSRQKNGAMLMKFHYGKIVLRLIIFTLVLPLLVYGLIFLWFSVGHLD